MKRLLTATAVCAVTLIAAAAPASADAALGTSFATAGKVTPGSATAVTVTNSGDISGLLDFVTPVLNQVVQPLAASLTTLPSTVVAQVAGEFSGMGAQSPATSTAPPASGYPSCTSAGWTADSCFGPVIPTVTAGAAVSLASGTVQGYAAADLTGSYAAARMANPSLTVLGVPFGSLGVSESKTTCPASGACTTTPTLTGLSLLNGSVAARTAADGTLRVSLNGSAFSAVAAYGTATTLSAGAVTATAVAAGTSLKITVSMTADQLLAALGLPSLASVGATDAGSTVRLTLTLGTGTTSATGSGESWGIEVGVGLDARIAVSVLGLVTIAVASPDSTTSGNLVDLKLAYTNAQTASTDATDAQPDLT